MNRLRPVSPVLVLALGMPCACSWTRFDDVTDNPPVDELDTPDNAGGIGVSMTAFASATGSELAVTSQDKLVLYDLGSGTDPSQTAAAVQSCPGDNSCALAKQLAGLKPSPLFDNLGCVAYGVGTSSDSAGSTVGQLWLLCEDRQRRSLAVPGTFTTWLTQYAITNQTQVSLATTRRSDVQPLVAAVPGASAIWYYDGIISDPLDLPDLPASQVAGRALAVIGESSGYLVAASSVTTDSQVWLYRVKSDRTAAVVGCIQGPADFGRLLATGQFDDDGVDDLAVADGHSITVIKGSSLSSIADKADTTCTAFDATQVIGQLPCSQWSVLDGCAREPFAASLASGNLDNAGPDELMVGAPNTSVRGESGAGAVFIYSAANGTFRTVQGLYVSTASSGDGLGTSVAIAHVSDIDTVVAGAPGSNSVLAFYCNSLMPTQSKSSRCP